eukprot:CAMPEP_0113674186 /NCGR_PEP_ID=MMETSP0038_2-20120614/7272_1 /TAXON_ID=2898 /ORGANISM="Cryptomonas paramecium" /LENGTH=286 /DNA_ID=CAMNT_0000590725 /DNA_START=828 /DNA_END=1688 /DNA_ORIENTATION=- /assembly_acc=CAM_ASM_000170
MLPQLLLCRRPCVVGAAITGAARVLPCANLQVTVCVCRPDEWQTESPLRTCYSYTGAPPVPCGSGGPPGTVWVDPLGRPANPLDPGGYRPSDAYGKLVRAGDPFDTGRWRWVPGDVPLSKRLWQGRTAGDDRNQEGLLSGSRVYPGVQHADCCLANTSSFCCRNSSRMRWTGPVDAYQADCMFAVKRAICAYHFWECDGDPPDRIYNGVCRPVCDDLTRLCGPIPSSGLPLLASQFNIQKYYFLGCTVEKSRKYYKDCTADGNRMTVSVVWMVVISIVLIVNHLGV